MEQIIQKPPFPIKTKIAVWWMIIGVVIETVVSFRFLVAEDLIAFLLFPILLILSRYYIQLRPGLFLLNRRRHGWWLAAISLSIILISLFIFASFQSPLNFGEQPGFILVALLILSVFPFLFPSILFFRHLSTNVGL